MTEVIEKRYQEYYTILEKCYKIHTFGTTNLTTELSWAGDLILSSLKNDDQLTTDI